MVLAERADAARDGRHRLHNLAAGQGERRERMMSDDDRVNQISPRMRNTAEAVGVTLRP
jgi:hypothetical protein